MIILEIIAIGGNIMVQGLAEKLKSLIIQNGYSQKQVADILDISASVLSGYESGEKTPSIEKLLKLSALYQVSIDWLLGVTKTDNHKLIDASHLSDEQFKAIKQLLLTM